MKTLLGMLVFVFGLFFMFFTFLYLFGLLKMSNDSKGHDYARLYLGVQDKRYIQCWIELPSPDAERCFRVD